MPRGEDSERCDQTKMKEPDFERKVLHYGSITSDKAWKVRPLLQALEWTFRRGYRMAPRISFDGGTIPNRSQFNPVRVFNKDRPHRYGKYTWRQHGLYLKAGLEVYMMAPYDSRNAAITTERKAAKEKANGVAQKA
ncbi:hypothetical protein PHMEG_00020569 [Phytophthora megakarya]|uniref:PiggyBac transposable element-derived protein domain-containing protein n=1 Tax=Phytophthora megakarya TaxID=4795 RepID=A0A225VPQ2_9STRA|nr:hypothetical protein PHMEG_00020569 [Phytophthora megakarya]